MTGENWFKRTNVKDVLNTVDDILTKEVVYEVKIEKLGSGEEVIFKLKAYVCKDDIQKLDEFLYERGWANDLETLSKELD